MSSALLTLLQGPTAATLAQAGALPTGSDSAGDGTDDAAHDFTNILDLLFGGQAGLQLPAALQGLPDNPSLKAELEALLALQSGNAGDGQADILSAFETSQQFLQDILSQIQAATLDAGSAALSRADAAAIAASLDASVRDALMSGSAESIVQQLQESGSEADSLREGLAQAIAAVLDKAGEHAAAAEAGHHGDSQQDSPLTQLVAYIQGLLQQAAQESTPAQTQQLQSSAGRAASGVPATKADSGIALDGVGDAAESEGAEDFALPKTLPQPSATSKQAKSSPEATPLNAQTGQSTQDNPNSTSEGKSGPAKAAAADLFTGAGAASKPQENQQQPLNVQLQPVRDVAGHVAHKLEQPTLHTPRHGIAPSPGEQVTIHMQKALQDGANRIQIQLQPTELGKVEIHIDIHSSGKASLLIMADKPETLELLQRDGRVLERSMQDSGLKLDTGGMQFNLRQSQQQAGMNGDGSGQRGGLPQNEQELAEPQPDPQALQRYRVVADNSLDIVI